MRVLVIAWLAIVFGTPGADACDCTLPAKACEGLAHIDVVFIGTVRAHTKVPAGWEVTVEVHEVLRGKLGATATITRGNDGSSCDYTRYQVGERMLLLAGQQGTQLSVSSCSGTGPVADNAARIADYRKAVAVKTGSISGKIDISRFPLDNPLPRANVGVRLAKTSFATTTDAQGHYHLDVRPGTYELELAADPSLVGRPTGSIEVRPGACVTFDHQQYFDNHITGTLRDGRGAPVPNVAVCIAVASKPEICLSVYARSDATGKYDSGLLPPGTYRVGVGVRFDPKEAIPTTMYPTPLTLGRGTQLTGIDLVVPPRLATHTITTTVRSRDKRLTGAFAEVSLREPASGRRQDAQAQLPSAVTLVEVAGTTVEVNACVAPKQCAPRRRIKLDRDHAIELVIPTR